MQNRLIAAVAVSVFTANAQSTEDRIKYERWNNVMDLQGYTWEPYEVETDDGWLLTLFRITGRVNEDANHDHKNRTPVLVTHGMAMSAVHWAEKQEEPGHTVWPLKLVDRGYDVWMATNRGATYSDYNKNDGQWPDEERWDFSFAEMGMFDQPAFIDKILEVTGEPKITYIGYSAGTTQMLYALGSGDWLNDKLRDVILVAPSLFTPGNTYEGIVHTYQGFKD